MKSFIKRLTGVLSLFAISFGLLACHDINVNNITKADIQRMQARVKKPANGHFPLIVINGKEAASTDALSLNPDDVKSISVIKGYAATKIYGEAGKNGLIRITLKGYKGSGEYAKNWYMQDGKKIYVFVDSPPRFKGDFITFQSDVPYPQSCRDAYASGRIRMHLIVDKKGVPTNVSAVGGKKGHGCGQAAIRAIKNHARFTLALEDGTPVYALKSLILKFWFRSSPDSASVR